MCCILIVSFSCEAQTSDFELWSGASAQCKLNDKFKLGFEQQVRLNNRLTSFKNTFSAASLKYKISERFAVKGTYRFKFVPNNHERVSADLIYSWSKKKFPLRVKNRLRYQRRADFVGSRTRYLRNKLQFEYNASKLVDPFMAGEIFYRLDRRNEFRVWRINTDLTWKLSKRLAFKT
ncbi:MAG: DUF2490 domain-containing protein [Fluviicola sp.]